MIWASNIKQDPIKAELFKFHLNLLLANGLTCSSPGWKFTLTEGVDGLKAPFMRIGGANIKALTFSDTTAAATKLASQLADYGDRTITAEFFAALDRLYKEHGTWSQALVTHPWDDQDTVDQLLRGMVERLASQEVQNFIKERKK